MISIRLRLKLLLLSLLVLFGCAGVPKPVTLDQNLATAEGQVTAGYTSVADLATRKRISAETGTSLIKTLDDANAALKSARILVGQGNEDAARTYLKIATDLLLKYEQTKGAVK
jgi:hypothetical protein